MRIYHKLFQLRELTAVDGDTLDAWADVGPDLRQKWRIRIKGIEGGELDTTAGRNAATILANELQRRERCTAHFIGNPETFDQHRRHVGDVYFDDGKALSAILLATGFFWKRDRNGTQHLPNRQGNAKPWA